MLGNPLNLPPVSIAAAKSALIEQYADAALRRRASMLWGTRGVGKSSIVRQVAAHHSIPLVDLRLTTIEPVDLRGAIYADDRLAKTVWFPPEFLPTADQPEGILFLDELTAADQRLQISAYSLILDRRVGNYRLPDGWQVIAAGNASFHGAVSPDMGTALADRMFHFNVQTAIDAFLDHAVAMRFAPEVMTYLKVRPDKLDDTQAQLAGDHLVGASPRGWEDISNVLQSGLSDSAKRLFVQGRIGAGNAAEFFGVLRDLQAAVDVVALLAARRGAETVALMPRSLDGLYGMLYGLLAAARNVATLTRALEIIEQLPGPQAGGAPPAAVELDADEARSWCQRLLRAHTGDGAFSLLRTLIADLPRTRTPWEQVLRTQLMRGLARRPALSWSRPSRSYLANQGRCGPHRRMPFEPGTSATRAAPRLALVVDVSGSIDDGLMQRFAREIEVLTRRLESGLVLVIGDDRVQRIEHFEPGRATLRGIAFKGGGGTDFTPLLEAADQHRPDLTVVLTDLQGPARYRPRCPVVWAVPEALAQAVPPFGRLLSLC